MATKSESNDFKINRPTIVFKKLSGENSNNMFLTLIVGQEISKRIKNISTFLAEKGIYKNSRTSETQ